LVVIPIIKWEESTLNKPLILLFFKQTSCLPPFSVLDALEVVKETT